MNLLRLVSLCGTYWVSLQHRSIKKLLMTALADNKKINKKPMNLLRNLVIGNISTITIFRSSQTIRALTL